MIPLRDNVPSRRRPWLTIALIAANIAVFWHELTLGPTVREFFETQGLVPARFFATADWSLRAQMLLIPMFIHVGWLHFAGNMLYLWIFGDNIEDRMGRIPYLVFYLAGGAAASFAQLALDPRSTIPIVGASGAISAILGAYLRLFPWARVLTVIPIFLFWQLIEIPALFFLVVWFVTQLANGTLALSATAQTGGGPAWWAHIGGFAAGFLLARLFAPRPRVAPRW